MKTKTIRLAVMAALSYFVPSMGFAQNPILRSTTAGTPSSFLQMTPSVMTQKNSFIGIGTTNPTQHLTIYSVEQNISHDETPIWGNFPTLRFSAINQASLSKIWDVYASDGFTIKNVTNDIKPLIISTTGEINIMNKISLKNQPYSGDNQFILSTDNTARRISWTSFIGAPSGNDMNIPLDFFYDAIGSGAADISIMKLMPTGQVRIGNPNTLYQNYTLGSAPNTNSSIRLTVDGNVAAKGFIATQQNWADFVFYAPQGNPTLEQEQNSIEQNCTLLGVPTETEAAEGRNLAENDALLLQKLEQLYLHVIELNKQMRQMETQIQELGRENEALKLQLDKK